MSSPDDIYNFDHLLNRPKEPARRCATYTVDKDEPRSRPLNRPKVNPDGQVHLPPVLVGRNLAAKLTKTTTLDRRTPVYMPVHGEIDYHKERAKLIGPKQPQKDVGVSYASRDYMTTPSGPRLGHNEQTTAYNVYTESRGRYNDSVYSSHHGDMGTRPQKENEWSTATTSQYVPTAPTMPKPREDNQTTYSRNHRYRSRQLDQDISVHKPSASYYRPPKSPVAYEIDFDKEVKEALQLQKDLEAYHEEMRLAEAEMAKRRHDESCRLIAKADDIVRLCTPETNSRPPTRVKTGRRSNAEDQERKSTALSDNLSDIIDEILYSPESPKKTSKKPFRVASKVSPGVAPNAARPNATRRPAASPRIAPNAVVRVSHAAPRRSVSQVQTPAPVQQTVTRIKVAPARPWNGVTATQGVGFKSSRKIEPEPKKTQKSLIPDKIAKELKKYFPK